VFRERAIVKKVAVIERDHRTQEDCSTARSDRLSPLTDAVGHFAQNDGAHGWAAALNLPQVAD
jgi:hypothetical protein